MAGSFSTGRDGTGPGSSGPAAGVLPLIVHHPTGESSRQTGETFPASAKPQVREIPREAAQPTDRERSASESPQRPRLAYVADMAPEPLPRVTVLGNCQAESLRILLDSSGALVSTRIPPVHELTEADLPALQQLLARTDVLVAQPVRADYRGLPIGTEQLRRHLPRHARTVMVPVLFFVGPTPYQAIVRDPLDPSLDPPLVPYHDLRILVAAAAQRPHPVEPEVSAATLRRAAELSIEQLRLREEHHGTVVMSDVLAQSPLWHTLNHPDNATLEILAQRILDRISPGSRATAPGDREMLGRLRAPVDPAAAAALGIEVPAGRETWSQDGVPIPAEELAAAHLEHYRRHPGTLAAGLQRHAERIALLGLRSDA